MLFQLARWQFTLFELWDKRQCMNQPVLKQHWNAPALWCFVLRQLLTLVAMCTWPHLCTYLRTKLKSGSLWGTCLTFHSLIVNVLEWDANFQYFCILILIRFSSSSNLFLLPHIHSVKSLAIFSLPSRGTWSSRPCSLLRLRLLVLCLVLFPAIRVFLPSCCPGSSW